MRRLLLAGCVCAVLLALAKAETALDLSRLASPVLLRGDAKTAYRDPAVIRQDGWFRLFFTLMKIEDDGRAFSYCAWSKSRDLVTWSEPKVEGGENACVLLDGGEYVLFHSPPNGVGVKRSKDLATWRDEGVQTLGQKAWPWAQGRLTGGFVLDLRKDASVGKALLFFHGSDYPEDDPRGGFDSHASIGIAWSDDLRTWAWPGVGQ